MIVTGNSSVQLLRADPQYVRGQGWELTLEYRGLQSDIEGLIPGLASAGYDVNTTTTPPLATLTATKYATSLESTQDYWDRYTIRKETIEKSIWSLDKLSQEGANWVGGFGAYVKVLKDATDGDWDNDDADAFMVSQFGAEVSTQWPVAWGFYREWNRGVESIEDTYTVLGRSRVVSLDYASQLVLVPPKSRLIYTKAQLQAAFDIPDFTGIVWPSEGTAVASSQWGWRNRNYEVRFVGSDRVEIVNDWVWAAWSTNIYTPAT